VEEKYPLQTIGDIKQLGPLKGNPRKGQVLLVQLDPQGGESKGERKGEKEEGGEKEFQ